MSIRKERESGFDSQKANDGEAQARSREESGSGRAHRAGGLMLDVRAAEVSRWQRKVDNEKMIISEVSGGKIMPPTMRGMPKSNVLNDMISLTSDNLNI